MIISEPFTAGTSTIHCIDPRIRLIFAFVMSLIIALSDRFSTLGASLFISMLFVALARLNIRKVMRRLLVVSGFLLLVWVTLPISYDGLTIYHLGPLDIAREGILYASRITLKSLSILMVFMAFVATMTIATLGHTLHRLKVPDKLVYLLLITYRYLFVIREEYLRLRTAMRIRGFKPGTNIHSYRTYAYLIGMLFVRASVRAERVNQAMRCRGFKGKFYSLDNLDSFRSFPLFSVLMVGTAGFLIILEWISL